MIFSPTQLYLHNSFISLIPDNWFLFADFFFVEHVSGKSESNASVGKAFKIEIK